MSELKTVHIRSTIIIYSAFIVALLFNTIKTVHIFYMYLFICFNCGALVIVYSALYVAYYRRLYGAYGTVYSRFIWRFICAAIINHVSAYDTF